jgi:hypothetical protein
MLSPNASINEAALGIAAANRSISARPATPDVNEPEIIRRSSSAPARGCD